jgi:hypothetical protein
MKPYGRLIIAIIVAVMVLIPLGVSVSLNDGPAIKVEGPDSLEGVATMDDTIFLATGQIQTAVNNADPGDTIFLWPKTYYGITDVNKNLNIIGSGALWTIVDGQKQGSAFTIFPDVTATLSGMTIQNGGNTESGGGIFNRGTLTVENCDIHHNYAFWEGGGIENYGPSMTVLNSEIHHNEASGTTGGIENWATERPASATLKGCWIHDNTANACGGVTNSDGEFDGSMKIYNCKIDHNTATASYGGGIFNAGDMTIYCSNINYNSAKVEVSEYLPGYGGGIFNTGDMKIYSSNINHNIAYRGGGILNYAGDMKIYSSNINYNMAGRGGGIYNYYGSLSITGNIFQPTVITRNTADINGGGIFWMGTEPVITGNGIIHNNNPDQIAHS